MLKLIPGKMKFIFCLLSLLVCPWISTATVEKERAHVVLISVATETGVFWAGLHAIARAAAKDLGVDLEILYGNRDHIRAVDLAKQVAQRAEKPDYAIVVGEVLVASKSIPVLCENGIKVFMYGSLIASEKNRIGEPRENFPNYIGKLSIDDYMAGYLCAETLIEHARKKQLQDSQGIVHILAFEGVRKTSFSSERVRGLRASLARHDDVNLLQILPTNWLYEDGTRMLPALLRRYSDHRVAGVWCANSAIARGCSDVFIGQGKKPNLDFVTVGTDWGADAIKSVERGDVTAIAGGHLAVLGWIVTLLHDDYNGIEFDLPGCKIPMTMMDQNLARIYLDHFSDGDWDQIDFKKRSKAENPDGKAYDFRFGTILNEL